MYASSSRNGYIGSATRAEEGAAGPSHRRDYLDPMASEFDRGMTRSFGARDLNMMGDRLRSPSPGPSVRSGASTSRLDDGDAISLRSMRPVSPANSVTPLRTPSPGVDLHRKLTARLGPPSTVELPAGVDVVAPEELRGARRCCALMLPVVLGCSACGVMVGIFTYAYFRAHHN